MRIVPLMVRTAPVPAPYLAHGIDGGLAQLGMVGEAEVVVGG